MGRPLYSSSTYSASCLCITCVPVPATQPETSSSTAQRSTSFRNSSSDRYDALRLRIHETETDLPQSVSESHQSLRRASSAIETAYQRLLALHLRLRDPSDRMSFGPPRADTVSSMGPTHSAIVLSSDSDPPQTLAVSDSDIVNDSTPPSSSLEPTVVLPTNGHPSTSTSGALDTIRQRFAELAGRIDDLDSSITGTRSLVSGTASPRRHGPSLFGPRSPTEPAHASTSTRRLTYMSSLHERRNASSSDSSTTLGRRVEARASAGRNVQSDNSRSNWQDFMEAADASLTLLARHSQQLLASSREFRQTEATPVAPSNEDQAPPAPSSHPNSLTNAATARRWLNIRDRAALWRQNTRDRRPPSRPEGGGDIFISFRRPHDDNGSSEPPALVSPSEPRTRTVSTDMPEHMPELEDETDDPTSRRSYRVRRRLESDPRSEMPYDSLVYPSENTDDSMSWPVTRRRSTNWMGLSPASVWPDAPSTGVARVVSAGESNESLSFEPYYISPDGMTDNQAMDRITFGTEGMSRRDSSANVSRRRRRGWARLDHDGNEIPTDEEEEYERSRMHMRLRAQALTSQSRNASHMDFESTTLPPAPSSIIANSFVVPTTQDYEPTPRQSPVFRVRLNSRDSVSSIASTVMYNDQPLQHEPSPPVPPFQPSPLPWQTLDPSSPTRTSNLHRKASTSKARYSLWSPFAGR